MSTIQQTEFLYTLFEPEQGRAEWWLHPILKRTKELVFVEYGGRCLQKYYLRLPRRELEERGEIYWRRCCKILYTEEGKRRFEQEQAERYLPESFKALGLPQKPTAEDAKRAYREMALKHHPDQGGSHEAFLQLEKNYSAALRTINRTL